MPQLITYGNELIRFNPSNNHIEVSTSRGTSWFTRYSGSGLGNIRDLLVFGSELLANTADGHLYVSTSKGTSWFRRR